jgi:hypothetical protein
VYRIVAGGVLSDDDFRSHNELGTAKAAPECSRCALSVYNSFAGALHRQNLSPHLGSAISEGILDVNAGVVELTSPRSGHVSWWSFDGVSRKTYFKDPTPCV